MAQKKKDYFNDDYQMCSVPQLHTIVCSSYTTAIIINMIVIFLKCRKVMTGVGSRAVCSSKVYIFVFSLTVVSSVVEC